MIKVITVYFSSSYYALYLTSHRFYRLVLVACLGLVLGFSATVNAQTEAEYQQRLQELSQSIKALQAELKNTQQSKDQLEESLQSSEEDISKFSKKVSEIKEALAREKKRLSQLQAQRAELVASKKTQLDHIQESIRHSYQLGQQSQLKLLLNQQDPQRIGRMMQYHQYIINAHQKKIADYSRTLEELASLEVEITNSRDQLAKRAESLSRRQKDLGRSQKQRRQTLAKLKQSLKTKGSRLKRLNGDRSHLQDLLDKATQALAKLKLPEGSEPFNKAKGKLPLPTKGKIIHRFGSRQFDGQLKRNGIFIQNRSGAKVVSVHHGRVIFSDYLRGHGLLLILDHGNGYMSLYGHNETLQKEIGDWVNTGDTIATVGNSGGQEKVGLYFEIRHQGRPQNPHLWLKS